MTSIEIIWEQILSRDEEQIRQAFRELDEASRREVLAHLRVMIREEGWHSEQRISAQKALDILIEEGKA